MGLHRVAHVRPLRQIAQPLLKQVLVIFNYPHLFDVVERIFGPSCRSVFREDSKAFIQACRHGRYPSMRHLPKMAGIDLQILNDVFGNENDEYDIDPSYTNSEDMCADIHTRSFVSSEKWIHARK